MPTLTFPSLCLQVVHCGFSIKRPMRQPGHRECQASDTISYYRLTAIRLRVMNYLSNYNRKVTQTDNAYCIAAIHIPTQEFTLIS